MMVSTISLWLNDKSLQGWLHGPKSPSFIVLEHEARVPSPMLSYLN
jgi:hypothetical protein